MEREKMYTVKEAQTETGLKETWWRSQVFLKKIRHHKIGGRILIPQSTIDKMFEDSVVEPVAALQ